MDGTGVKEESVKLKSISKKGAERLLATTITVDYSTSAGYTPDSTENTEGFDTETFVEDPSSEVTPDLSSDESVNEGNGAMLILVIIVGLLVLTIVVGLIAYVVLGKKDSGYSNKNPKYE